LLRTILGRYLDVAPGTVRFCYGPHGKPALIAEMAEQTGVRFNVAHSHDLALYAVTRGREVGIDVERIRAEVASTEIAQRFFSPAEVAALCALPDELQTEAFFACWTRKEAYIKATGGGLSHPLDGFDVSLTPGEPVVALRTHADPQEAARWSLRALDPGPGYAAAVAVEATRWNLTCWQWRV
jgi:4'-phosphopantetheinyl transferase